MTNYKQIEAIDWAFLSNVASACLYLGGAMLVVVGLVLFFSKD